MTATECTSTKFKLLAPIGNKKMVNVQCTTTNAADYVTLTDYFAVCEGAYLISTGGTIAAFGTFSGTGILFSNGATGTKIWNGFAWGY